MRNMARGLLVLLFSLGAAACSDEPITPSGDMTRADGPPAGDIRICGPGTTQCGGSCVSTSTDPNHCGACGNSCKAGQVCVAGVCGVSCPAGQVKCSGTDAGAPYCATVSSDPRNCGACGNACKTAEVCSAGKCALSCPSGLSKCGGGDAGPLTCVNFNTDNTNCGACGNTCKAGEVCSSGACSLSCPAGLTKCGGGDAGAPTCANTQSDATNCGACGNVCKAGEVCSAGACSLSCPPALTKCGGGDAGAPYCANTTTDVYNCGTCGAACKAGELCTAGACALSCPAGLTQCGGGDGGAPYCANTATDATNCGACASSCKAGELCNAGKCALSCPAGLTKCGGSDAGPAVCANIASDPMHCGACSKTCASGQVCSGGACATTCKSGETNCSGACANLQTDANHCGGCSKACKAGETCCSGACAALQSDTKNCGSCGNACKTGEPCIKGNCRKATSCAAILAANPGTASGVYSVYIGSPPKSVDVYCDMTTAGGGWTMALNLDTSDGHVMWWADPRWTDKKAHGTVSSPFVGDHKSLAWTLLDDVSQLMLVVHQQGVIKGYKTFLKPDKKALWSYFQGGDNTLLGKAVISSSIINIWSKERLVRLSKQLHANHCVQTGGKCTSGSTGSPDGDRVGSHESNPSDNNGGGLGNWHDMNYCCKGKNYGSGKVCNGGGFRTVSEAQAGWVYASQGGTFGSDSAGPITGTGGSSPCGSAGWAKKSGIDYDYAIFVRRPAIPTSCAEHKLLGATTDGVYKIDPNGDSPKDAFTVYCDMTTDGGGWTIVYAATGANGEQPMVSNKLVGGHALTFKHHNQSRARKAALSALSSESILVRKGGTWLKMNRPLFDAKLTTPNSHAHYAVKLTASSYDTASGWIGYTNQLYSGGGDYNISAADGPTCSGLKSTSGVDHHSTGYYHLNGCCARQYLYSYSAQAYDWDAGYDVNTGLGSWAVTQKCDIAEGGKLAFWAGMR